MVLNMGLFNGEKRKILSFIATWEPYLSDEYRRAWENWKRKRDIIANAMGLTEKEKLYITHAELARYAKSDISNRVGLNEETAQKFVKTRGTTKILETTAKLATIYKEYRAKCDFIDEFDKRMEKLTPKR